MSLPVSMDCPDSRTPVTLTVQVKPQRGDYLYLKTVYAPLQVYADGERIFQYGQDGSYPAFLRWLSPLTKFCLVMFGEHQKRLMNIQCLILETAVGLAIIAQFAGIVSLSKTMYLFHLYIPPFCERHQCVMKQLGLTFAFLFYLPSVIIFL